MEPDSVLLIYVFGGVVVLTLLRVARAFPVFGVMLGICLWVMGCATVAAKWDVAMPLVLAGGVVGLVLLGVVLLLVLWIAERFQDRF